MGSGFCEHFSRTTVRFRDLTCSWRSGAAILSYRGPTLVSVDVIEALPPGDDLTPDDFEVSPKRVITSLETLSPSRASDFKRCPQLFKYKSIERLPEPTTVYQARGTAAHAALEGLYDMDPAERTPEALYDLFRSVWSQMRHEEEYADLFADVAEERAWGVATMGLLRNYFAVEDPTAIIPMERELDLTEELDGMRIRGILDRMDETPDGELVILDYKTGKAPPQRFAEEAFFAMKIYAVLIRHRTGRTPKELRLLYLTGPNLLTRAVDDAMLDAMAAEMRGLWDAINAAIANDDFPTRTSRLCDWCYFKPICPAFAEP